MVPCQKIDEYVLSVARFQVSCGARQNIARLCCVDINQGIEGTDSHCHSRGVLAVFDYIL